VRAQQEVPVLRAQIERRAGRDGADTTPPERGQG
jgi:hypothetical protein